MAKHIKILYAPYNIASMPGITVESFNKIEGVIAKGICCDSNGFLYFGNEPNKSWKRFNIDSNINKNWFLFFYNLFIAEFFLIYRIFWCDIIIWQWDIKKYMPHYWFIKLLRKPILVEWLGSDIRIPEIVKKENPYYEKSWNEGKYTYIKESIGRSNSIQKKFKRLNAIPLLCPEMTLFLNYSLYPTYFTMMQRVNIKKFEVRYPSTEVIVPLICHAPSAYGAKGTFEIRKLIDKLNQIYTFNYKEIYQIEHRKALELISSCDIFLDQFILGSYGMAACEALSMGKPVFCYIMPCVKALLPKDYPIIDCNLEEIETQLIKLITNPILRHEIGICSRKYVEKYHDVDLLAPQLMQIILGQI